MLSLAFPINHDTRRDAHTARKAVEWFHQEATMQAHRSAASSTCRTHTTSAAGWVKMPNNMGICLFPSRYQHYQRIFPAMTCINRPRASTIPVLRSQSPTAKHPLGRTHLATIPGSICPLLRRADKHIGDYSALDKTGMRDDTTIIFTADHGDGLGCRHLATKHCSFYDETTRIPFIVSGAGVEPPVAMTVGNQLGRPAADHLRSCMARHLMGLADAVTPVAGSVVAK